MVSMIIVNHVPSKIRPRPKATARKLTYCNLVSFELQMVRFCKGLSTEDAKAIPHPVGGSGILRDHGTQACRRHQAASNTDHEHASSGIDFVVQPGASWVVDEAGRGKPDGTEQKWPKNRQNAGGNHSGCDAC